MQKRIFMPKGSQAKDGGSRSMLKWLFLAAVALVLLVIAAPMVMHQKGGTKDTSRKAAEKGAVVKEIPRTLELMQDKDKSPQATALNEGMPTKEMQGVPGESSQYAGQPAGAPVASSGGSVPPEPASVKPATEKGAEPSSSGHANTAKGQEWIDISQAKPSSPPPPAAPAEKTQMAAVRESSVPPPAPSRPNEWVSVEKGGKESKSGKESKGSKLGPVGKEGAPKASAAPVSKASPPKPTKPAQPASAESPEGAKALSKSASASGAPAAAKSAPSTESAKPPAGGAGAYSVQVGSFKEKENADEMQKSLQKKGYGVTVKVTSHPKLGQLYVVQLQPVNNVSRASTLVEQIKHEEKVKPVIVRTGSGE